MRKFYSLGSRYSKGTKFHNSLPFTSLNLALLLSFLVIVSERNIFLFEVSVYDWSNFLKANWLVIDS